MPIHKLLFGDKDKAAAWLGFAVSKLSLLGGRFNQQVFAPRAGVRISIKRAGAQEFIQIYVQAAEIIYEYITSFYSGGGLYGPFDTEKTLHHIGKSVRSSEHVRGVVVSDYNEDAIIDSTSGNSVADGQNNLWISRAATKNNQGDIVYTNGQVSVSAGYSFNYHVCNPADVFNDSPGNSSIPESVPSYDTPVYITDLRDGTETKAPPAMLVIAAAINNGVLIGIDRNGKVFASSSFDDMGTVYSITPAMPSFIFFDGDDTTEAMQWRFNGDGTKAICCVQETEDNMGVLQVSGVGGIVEMSITAIKNEDDSISLTASVTTTLPTFDGIRNPFAADYYLDPDSDGDEVRIVADAYSEAEEDYSNPSWGGEGRIFGYVRMVNLDTEQVYKTVLTYMTDTRADGVDEISAYPTKAAPNGFQEGLIALDLKELAYVTRLAWHVLVYKSTVACDYAEDAFGNRFTSYPGYTGPVCSETGAGGQSFAGTDIDVFTTDTLSTVAVVIEAGDKDGVTAREVTGEPPYDVSQHDYYNYIRPAFAINSFTGVLSSPHFRSTRTIASYQGNVAAYLEAKASDYVKTGVLAIDYGLLDMELDVVIPNTGDATTHRALYNNLRQAQLDATAPDVLPELADPPAYLYSTITKVSIADPAPMIVGSWFYGGNEL